MLLPKVSVVPTLLIVLARHASAYPSVSPTRIAYESLDGAKPPPSLLLGGLTRDGIVSVTGIPNFDEVKRALMSHLHDCITSIDDGDVVPTEHYRDGTIRRSFAASTDGAGPRPVKSLEEFVASLPPSESGSCGLFRDRLTTFRSAVDRVTGMFAERLSAEMGMGASLPAPLLRTSDPAGRDYEDIAAVVAGGVHLEHFHSYQKEGDRAAMGVVADGIVDGETIEFHTDQGFFIAFTPGLIVSPGGGLELSDGFYVQGTNGEKLSMEFTGEDDLVFMMGDGVNQIINNKLVDGHAGLRATPHALTLTAHEDEARVWYGRMVLAPNDAYLPSSSESTFGEVRQFFMDSSSNGEIPVGIGCSSPTMQAVITTARSLESHEGTNCTQDELFCWFRCMALADHDLTVDSCTERDLQVQCMNPRGQVLKDGEGHGDYFPECTNRTHETHPVTDVPMIDQQDAAVCTSDKWEEFIGTAGYDHAVELTNPNGTETYLLWSVVEDDAGAKKIKARLAFDNVFGWLALGFANVDDENHNGMNGASIIMAIPGGNYAADTGLDLSVDRSVATYKIDPEDSAFRIWMTPIETDETKTTAADVEESGCFTALTFESDHINGLKFNINGTDEMIWGGNSNDIWMGYHGHTHRSRFTVDWSTGEMAFFGMPMETVAESDGQKVEGSAGSMKSCVVGIISLAFASLVLFH